MQRFDKYELELRSIVGDPLLFNKGYVFKQQLKTEALLKQHNGNRKAAMKAAPKKRETMASLVAIS